MIYSELRSWQTSGGSCPQRPMRHIGNFDRNEHALSNCHWLTGKYPTTRILYAGLARSSPNSSPEYRIKAIRVLCISSLESNGKSRKHAYINISNLLYTSNVQSDKWTFTKFVGCAKFQWMTNPSRNSLTLLQLHHQWTRRRIDITRATDRSTDDRDAEMRLQTLKTLSRFDAWN